MWHSSINPAAEAAGGELGTADQQVAGGRLLEPSNRTRVELALNPGAAGAGSIESS